MIFLFEEPGVSDDDLTTGIDQGSPDGDKTAIALRRDGMVYIATLPDQFGRVTKLEERNGRIVVTSETGDTMIVRPNTPNR